MNENCNCLCAECTYMGAKCQCQDICEIDEAGNTIGNQECQWFERKGKR